MLLKNRFNHSFKETPVHLVLGCQLVDVARGTELLVVAYHDELLAAGRERSYNV